MERANRNLTQRCLTTFVHAHGLGTLVASNMYDHASMLKRMEAVIRVVLDEALKPILFHRSGAPFVDAINQHLENTRAYLLRHASVEERVVLKSSPPANNHVELDGKSVFSCRRREDAEIYRLGLIAKLKEKESNA